MRTENLSYPHSCLISASGGKIKSIVVLEVMKFVRQTNFHSAEVDASEAFTVKDSYSDLIRHRFWKCLELSLM